MGKSEQDGRRMILLAVLLLLAGCAPKEEKMGAGRLEDGVYINPYIGLNLPVPEGWDAKSPPLGISQFLKFYLQALAAKEDTGSEKRVIPLVRMATTPAGALRATDAVITVAAARVGDKRRFDTAHAVKIARIFLKGSPTPVVIKKDFHSEILGGVSFVVFEVEWTEKQGGVTETCYLALRRGYALVISLEAKKPEGLKRAKKALESLHWGVAAPPESE